MYIHMYYETKVGGSRDDGDRDCVANHLQKRS